MTRTDIGDTFQARRFDGFTWVVHGALAAGDVLGDTTAEEGRPLPAGRVTGVDYHLGTADDGNTEITVHNVTAGTSGTLTLSTNAVDEDEGLDLKFSEGDELALEVTNTNTPGSDLTLALRVEQSTIA